MSKGMGCMTEEIFRDNAYVKNCEATVTEVNEYGIQLDRTVFYPAGGGQPGDTGVLRTTTGAEVMIADTIHEKGTGIYLHVAAEGSPTLSVGDTVNAEIDWERRYAHMRMHSGLHLLCAVVDGGVTGGSIGAAKSRLDFDLPDTSLDKEQLTMELNQLISEDHQVTCSAITSEELIANPELVRTMSVQPPTDAGSIRVIGISDVDLQPCGGTHVKSTKEIGQIRIGKIENKGKMNRRVNLSIND